MKKTKQTPMTAPPSAPPCLKTPKISLVPRAGIIAAASAMEDGLEKYERNDWLSRLCSDYGVEKFDHAMAHLLKFGEDFSDARELAHAIADLCIVAEVFGSSIFLSH